MTPPTPTGKDVVQILQPVYGVGTIKILDSKTIHSNPSGRNIGSDMIRALQLRHEIEAIVRIDDSSTKLSNLVLRFVDHTPEFMRKGALSGTDTFFAHCNAGSD